ncbi:HIT domain [Geosmithia morbida]|uniref:HIT domain n=1 Tax=Geosmithia morbida TaxID=1094350 RepID=A0A9P4YV47_9HYPO|nr:HIT domain [Geosmithia morbida]KAF4122276.1 HIT domain [Geosmithia morbida]
MSYPEPTCPFCLIAASHAPFTPGCPPSNIPPPTTTTPSSFVVLSTPSLISFLDIMPLSRGHLLLCPRAHRTRLTDTTPAESRRLGAAARLLSAALKRATGVADWNVLQNNGAAAAQVVPHVHYHLIPRPDIRARGRMSESFTMFGRGTRQELDDDEAEVLAASIRRHVAAIVAEEGAELVDDLEMGPSPTDEKL